MFYHLSRSRILSASCLIAALSIVSYVTLYAGPREPTRLSPQQSDGATEKDVNAFVAELVATFNKRDAQAVGAMFSANGELVDADGNVLKTRAALISHYENIFNNAKQAKLTVTTDTVRVINDKLAMYDGVATVKHTENQPQRESRFAAVLSKEGDKWVVASIRDLEEMEYGPAALQDKLSALKWLVGDWVEEGGSYRLHTSCQWSEDKLSLIQHFTISGPSLKDLKGTQRISWDPATQKIKSWTHDSLGGHAEALWTSSGDQWVVKSTGCNSDGDATSLTMIYRPIDKGRIDLISRDRVVGDEVMPDIAVTMVPRPPEPKP
jgi:uncharacterized protein (TIGR02246 family)